MIDQLIRQAICRITCGDDFGTGHLVASNIVLTARHCVEKAIDSGEIIELCFTGSEGEVTFSASVLDASAELDACLLSISTPFEGSPIPLAIDMALEGSEWRSFGYPVGKTTIGHRLSGTVSHVLNSLTAKIDLDLSIGVGSALQDYHGLSGAPVVGDGTNRGMIRLKVDGTIGAISIRALVPLLKQNGIALDDVNEEESKPANDLRLANRTDFQSLFETHILSNPSTYLFLEGAHGIGKTTFCNTFVPFNKSLFVLGTYSVALPNSSSDAYTRSQPEVFFDWLSTTITSLLYGTQPRQESRSYTNLVKEAESLFNAFSQHCQTKKQHGLVFIDGLNEILDTDQSLLPRFLAVLPPVLIANITVVLTAPSYARLESQLSSRIISQNVLSLPPLTTEACESFCWKELSDSRANITFIGRLCSKAQGHPLYLRYLIAYANDHLDDEDLDEFPILHGKIEQYYTQIWARILSNTNEVHLLAIISRLRSGLSSEDLIKVLTPAEKSVFIPTIRRIQHLLIQNDELEIYHASFSHFVLSKSATLEEEIQRRLGIFCQEHTEIPYCTLNIVYHLLRGNKQQHLEGVLACDQHWVDSCVILGINPDTLIADVTFALEAGTQIAPPVETFRLLLLKQRVEFRYNTLLAQSADLIADALIALKRPKDALKHVIRHNTLITDTQNAEHIVHTLMFDGYLDEASELLATLNQRISELYSVDDIDLNDFVRICTEHIRILLLSGLINGDSYNKKALQVEGFARKTLKESLPESQSDLLLQYISNLFCIPLVHKLYFYDSYIGLEKFRELVNRDRKTELQGLVSFLLSYADFVDSFELFEKTELLGGLFADIQQIIDEGEVIDKLQIPLLVDTLIEFGAPFSMVNLIDGGSGRESPSPTGSLRDTNGIDVDFSNVHRKAIFWKAVGYFDENLSYPLIQPFNNANWLTSIEEVIHALFFSKGRLLRAKAENNDSMRNEASNFLCQTVLPALNFALAQRVSWERSYAIPEALMPFIYKSITEILVNCMPEQLVGFIQDLGTRSTGQLGLYSEGYRSSVHVVVNSVLRSQDASIYQLPLFNLLSRWRDHVLGGVENRHELVPELLRLITAFTKVKAHEEAQRLFQYMLSVSMGPSWYKEDQFGLITSVISQIPQSEKLNSYLPTVAGYLERATGEMTFQRYIRYEKSIFIGILFAKNLFWHGCTYFKQQTCGTTEQLLSEWESNGFDAPSPKKGTRHPGGALDEQQAILEMVRHADRVSWRLRWALLEIFNFGDDRHTESFATAFADIFNEVGMTSTNLVELVSRFTVLANCEISPSDRNEYIHTFQNRLNPIFHSVFPTTFFPKSSYLPSGSNATLIPTPFVPKNTENMENSIPFSKETPDLYMPGVFGQAASMMEADEILGYANQQLALGNKQAAKNELTRMLQHLQEGGWSIWGNLSTSATLAEDMLREISDDSHDLLVSYAPLLKVERHTYPWRIADHLISRISKMLSPEEQVQLLDVVLRHIGLMVGDASKEIERFSTLNKVESLDDPDKELFSLILWLLDHPKWIRRDKSALALAWILESDHKFDKWAIETAFSMSEGYAAEVIGGIFDYLSCEQPLQFWERISVWLDIDAIETNCIHVSRLATLYRIADRAKTAGSDSGEIIATRVSLLFRSESLVPLRDSIDGSLPVWADCIRMHWAWLKKYKIVPSGIFPDLVERLTKICAPLSIEDAYDLEKSVSESFREPLNLPLNRWEAKVRFSLNCALFPYTVSNIFNEVPSELRIHNPTIPETTLDPTFDSPFEKIMNAIHGQGNYYDVIGNNDSYFLNYDEIAEFGKENKRFHIQIVAIIAGENGVNDINIHEILYNSAFYSRKIPINDKKSQGNATCFRIDPQFAFLGVFSPGFPTPLFSELIKAKDSEYNRVSWRIGRSSEGAYMGHSIKQGCLLSIKKSAMNLPNGQKIIWCVHLDGNFAILIDAEDHQVYLNIN